MKRTTILHLIVFSIATTSLLSSCAGDKPSEQPPAEEVSTEIPEPAPTVLTPADTFFFSSVKCKEIGEMNQLDMFKLDPANTLVVTGKSVDDLNYKIGDPLKEFLFSNLEGLNNFDYSKIDTIDWATDMTGDDTKIFVFENGKLVNAHFENE